MRSVAILPLFLSGVLALWTALACAEQAALPSKPFATPASVAGKSSTPATAETSGRADQQALQRRDARNAVLAQANAEHLAAIDLGGAPCSWKALIARTAPIPFRSSPGQAPFVRFSRGVLAARVERGAPTTAYVMSDGGGIVLHAFADVRELSFYPAHALTLNGFVRLHASAPISVSHVENAQLDFSYRLSDEIGLRVDPARVSVTVPCSAVALVEQREAFDANADRCSTTSVLTKSRGVPLAITSNGPVIARLAIEDYAAVDILERRANQVRVDISRADDTIFGWVPVRAVSEGVTLGCHGGGGAGVGEGQSFSIDETARCLQDIPLAIEQGSKRSQVGFIRAETSFKIVARGSESVRVGFFADSGLLFQDSAMFVIDASALSSCRVRSPPGLPSDRHRRDGSWPRSAVDLRRPPQDH